MTTSKTWIFLVCCLVFVNGNVNRFDSKFPLPKTWWAKQMTEEIYTAGRLTENEVKYAIDAGFKTIFSNFNFTTRGNFGGEPQPTTDEMIKIIDLAPETAFGGVISITSPWEKIEHIQRFGDLLKNSARPVLFHCGGAFSATFVVLGYFAMESRKDPNFRPRVTSENFFKIASSHGLDYSRDSLTRLVSEVTGQPIVKTPEVPDTNPKSWTRYWHAKHVLKNYFAAGLVSSSKLAAVKSVGYQTLVNTRRGLVTRNGSREEPSQEEVNLLNIHSNTGTYVKGGRQSPARLLETRIDENRDNRFIGPESVVNYESRNPVEFGDDIGYNEVNNKNTLNSLEISYEHMPMGSRFEDSNRAMWELYKDRLLAASKKGPVLVQCRSSRRAATLALLGAGWEYNRDSEWAIAHARVMGYHFNEQDHAPIFKVFREVLDQPRPFRTRGNRHKFDMDSGVDAYKASALSLVLTTMVLLFNM